ncbi:DUF2169 domain-containing protein [uncultured Roseibium sp.]|uniref:DUF2169 domain-containing protein n=1 Tax=uncultured Roseibium sp. TaxID=1936171 RepID=UPI002620A111|nr:DUF2169 domain-containing protein [uncultured Roseibium sp.]
MVKVIKPTKLSCVQNVQTFGSAKYLVATLYYGADLSQTDTLVSEDQYLSISSGRMPAGTVADLGFPKGQPEVLIAGEAQAPGGIPAQSVEVSVSVGDFRKAALVFGKRFWTRQHRDDFTLTHAEAFESLPLDPRHAFGGETHAVNKLGKGFQIDHVMQQFGYAPLPNIENPKDLVLHPADAPEPVLFGPLDAEHPLRKSCLGQVDGAWMHTTFPGPPPGFKFDYFNVAPQDQRLAEPLSGDEKVVVKGMQADVPELRGHLPGLVPRLFAVHDDKAETLTEIGLKFDTLWIFGSDALAGVYFGGLLEVTDAMIHSLAGFVAGLERLSEEPRSAEHYAEVFRLRTDPVDGPLHALNEQQLMPVLSETERQAVEARSRDYTEKVARKTERHLHASLEDMKSKSGLPEALLPGMKLPDVPRIPLPDPDDLVAGRVDMAGALKETFQAMDALSASDGGTAAQAFIEQSGLSFPQLPARALEDAIKSGDPQTGELFKSTMKDLTDPSLLAANAKMMASAETGLKEPQAGQEKTAAPETVVSEAVDDILQKLNIATASGGDDEVFQRARARALSLPEADPFYKLKQQLENLDAPDLSIPDPKSLVPQGALDAFGDDSSQGSKKTETFEDAAAIIEDMNADTKAVLDKVDAALADLLPGSAGKKAPPNQIVAAEAERLARQHQEAFDAHSLLGETSKALTTTVEDFYAELDKDERELLAGQDHERSQLPQAIYPLEDYSEDVRTRLGALVAERLAAGESFSRRDIAGANLSGRDLGGGLDFSGTLLETALLTQANLRHAILTASALTDARMEGAQFDHAELSRANLSKCTAPDASFRHCNFSERYWLEPSFRGADFEGSRFSGLILSRADLAGANLSNCFFEDCTFLNCDLTGGKFDNSKLRDCTFIECTAPETSWSSSHLEKVLFTDLQAPGSNWSNMTISKSNFAGKTDLSGAAFDSISAHHVCFFGTSLRRGRFVKSKMRECSFLNCDFSHSDCRAFDGKRSMFTGVDLRHANLVAANLLEAQFDGCDATAANFRSASLYGANLSGLTLAAADLTGAYTGRTILELPSHVD